MLRTTGSSQARSAVLISCSPALTPGAREPGASAAVIISPGANGSRMAAANSCSFEPKKWCTSAGSTAASAAIDLMVAAS